MDGDFNDGILDILSTCVYCGKEFEIDSKERLFTKEKCSSTCKRQSLVTYLQQDNELVRFEVSDQDGNYD
tara:strand:- start:170 stop:379 length:210 start_codon:yes stop_codon:yes gene_type:complete